MALKSTKKRKSGVLNIEIDELQLLRDVMSVVIESREGPPGVRVSDIVADFTKLSEAEQRLWKKVKNLCVELQVPVEKEAPDYVITMVDKPFVNIFEVEPSA